MMSEQKPEQSVQAEWEVVEPAASRQASPKASRAAMFKTLLGPWWRWKIAGLILSLAVIAAFVFAMAGVMLVIGVVTVLVSLVVAKVRQMLRQSSNSLTR
jgi:predicted lipid-binding transport protein (Tim44 family)